MSAVNTLMKFHVTEAIKIEEGRSLGWLKRRICSDLKKLLKRDFFVVLDSN